MYLYTLTFLKNKNSVAFFVDKARCVLENVVHLDQSYISVWFAFYLEKSNKK